MRVSRLEIFGFKSFVDRFVMNFDRPMIGVVGPNGCGKSNIVDSLRWVLGETHARQLRGGVLEDLIFNGSDSRRPLGMAEVSLTVRPHEGWAPATVLKLQELASSDRGEFEKVEGETETEVSAEAPAEEELPQQAARANTATTLLQLPGLFDATEIQLTRRLYRSGESEYFINRVPCRLRDMVEFYRIIGLASRGLSIVQQGQVGDIISRKPEELRELLEEAAGIAGFRARIDAAQRRLTKTSENLARLRDIAIEREKHVRTLGRQAKRARERNSVREELRQRELELFQHTGALIFKRDERNLGELAERETALNELKTRLDELTGKLEAEQRSSVETDEIVAALRSRREEVLREVRALQERENELRLLVSRLESRARGNRFQQAELEQGLSRIVGEISSITAQIESSAQTLAELRQKKEEADALLKVTVELESGSTQGGEIREQIKVLQAELSEREIVRAEFERVKEEIRTLGRRERELSQRLSEKRAEIASVKGQERTILLQLEELSKASEEELKAENSRVLLQGITAPEGVELALLAALGERGRYIVAEGGADLLQQLSENRSGKKSVGVVVPQRESFTEPGDRLLLAALKIEPWAKSAALSLLGGMYLAEDLAEASELRAQYGEEISVVTKTGILLAPWGFFASGENGVQNFRLTRLLEESRLKLTQIGEDVRALEDSERELKDELRAREEERVLLEQKVVGFENIAARLQQLERKERELERAELDRRLQEERRVQAILRDASSRLSAEEGRTAHLRQNLEHRLSEKNRAGERLLSVQSEWSDLETEFSALKERVFAECGAELASNLEEFLLAPTPDLQFRPDSALEESLLKAESELAARESEQRLQRKRYNELQAQREQVSKELLRVQERVQELRLLAERARLELEHLKSEVADKFGPEFELPVQESLRELELHSLESVHSQLTNKVRLLKNRLEQDAEVDPSVIEEYEVERGRFAELETQIQDLEGAQKTLERTIRHLRELSRQRFIETYRDVADRFATLVPRLFGGGSGQMDLLNPDDPLATGVIISVRPPGKKLRSLDLLSGGEKALTATAVLLAMFLHRPSPICVLDEVDAPLDDANLERFLNLIREISETTQMLVITHNKQSMLASDRLVGITMQEPGVSKALSVTFDEAIEELEAANA
jgi:chromosome segregation protein